MRIINWKFDSPERPNDIEINLNAVSSLPANPGSLLINYPCHIIYLSPIQRADLIPKGITITEYFQPLESFLSRPYI